MYQFNEKQIAFDLCDRMIDSNEPIYFNDVNNTAIIEYLFENINWENIAIAT